MSVQSSLPALTPDHRAGDVVVGPVRSRGRQAAWWTGYPAAVVVIVMMYVLGVYATTSESPTSDEPAHIVGGYIHYTLGEPRVHTENGYLSQAIEAFPLLFIRPHLDTTTSAFKHAAVFPLGREFLYHEGNNPDQILLLARSMVGLLTAVTALVVYGWSRRLFSPAGGMLSLVLFAFGPVVLAHGFLATSDMPATCFFILSIASVWATMQTVTLLRVVISGLCLAGLFLAKMSAPIVLPVLVVMGVGCVFRKKGMGWRMSAKRWGVVSSRWGKMAMAGGILVAAGGIVYVGIWGVYGFTYSAFKKTKAGETFYPAEGWTWVMQSPNGVLHDAIDFAREHRLLPEAYLYGYAYVAQSSQDHNVFVNGTYDMGVWWFFPYVFLLTTPLGFLMLGGVAFGMGYVCLRRRFSPCALPRLPLQSPPDPPLDPAKSLPSPDQILPVLALFVVYWLAAIPNYRNATGPRHLLPAYAALCILIGACAAWRFKRRWARVLVLGILPAWFVGESAWVYPHELSYFSEAVGGPSQGYRYLSDSSVDWGQDLPALAAYLKGHNPAHLPVYFAYFGNAEPGYYGIHARPLPSYIAQESESDRAAVKPLEPGLYCVSATMFSKAPNEMSAPPWPMSKEITMAEYLHFLTYCQRQKPVGQAGYSINIYRFSAADLAAALKPGDETRSHEETK